MEQMMNVTFDWICAVFTGGEHWKLDNSSYSWRQGKRSLSAGWKVQGTEAGSQDYGNIAPLFSALSSHVL